MGQGLGVRVWGIGFRVEEFGLPAVMESERSKSCACARRR